jgi:predicted nucleic acid-binding protein
LRVYADTSFLVSLYTPDVNSGVAARKMRGARDVLLLTSFGEVELTNAIELRVYRRELTATEVKLALAALESDVRDGVYTLTPVPAAMYEKARQLSRSHTAKMGTRTLDVLYVAAALVLKADAFYTFDRRQSDLAKAVDFSIPIRVGFRSI